MMKEAKDQQRGGFEADLYNDAVVLAQARQRLCQLCILHDNGLAQVLRAFRLKTCAPGLKVPTAWNRSTNMSTCKSMSSVLQVKRHVVAAAVKIRKSHS